MGGAVPAVSPITPDAKRARIVLGGLLLCLALSLCGGGCSTIGRVACPERREAAAPALLTPEQSALNLESFEQVWRTIRDTHWDESLGGLDWRGVHDEFAPRVERATTMGEARAAMVEMIGLLKQSHFAIFPAEVYADLGGGRGGEGVAGLEIRLVDGRVLVTAVDGGSAAETAGIGAGWELLAVDGEPVAEIAGRLAAENVEHADRYLIQSVQVRLQGNLGGAKTLRLVDGDGREVDLELTLARDTHDMVTFGHLPPMRMDIETRELPGNVGYFGFTLFLDPPRLMGAFNGFMAASLDRAGIVIDLRGNPGGIGGLATGMGGWFAPEKNLRLGTMITRNGEMHFVLNLRPRRYEGPLVVLIDELSGSTSEIFAGGLQALGLAHVIGRRSAGAALPSNIDRLPNGDGFQYAVANFVDPTGQQLEGRGVAPDTEAGPTREALLAGRDLPLALALDWIRGQRGVALEPAATGEAGR